MSWGLICFLAGGVFVSWLGDGLDPVCGPQGCSGEVLPLLHQYGPPVLRWLSNPYRDGLLLVTAFLLYFGCLVLAYVIASRDEPHVPELLGGVVVLWLALAQAAMLVVGPAPAADSVGLPALTLLTCLVALAVILIMDWRYQTPHWKWFYRYLGSHFMNDCRFFAAETRRLYHSEPVQSRLVKVRLRLGRF